MKKAVVAFLLGAVLAGGVRGLAAEEATHPKRFSVRWCPEDAVHVGKGDFNGTRWTWYRCVARDDF